MRILIIGGAGFIGSQLGFYLKEKGHNVILIDNLKYGYIENLTKDGIVFPNFICMDVRDPKLESITKNIDIIFHLAGISSLPECNLYAGEAYQCNVAGTANVLEIARRAGVKRLIFSSTSAVYENSTTFPSRENSMIKPTLIYSLSKKHAEDLCQSFIKMYKMDIVILRFFNVYGPHMDYLRPNPPLISYIIKCLLNSERPMLHSDGKQARDMIYVSDVLRMCEIVMVHQKAKNEIFNVGSGVTATVQEVYGLILKVFKKKGISPIYREPVLLWEKYQDLFTGNFPLLPHILEKEVNKFTLASIDKAKNLLGWTAEVSLDEGLSKTVDYAIRTNSIKTKKKNRKSDA